MSTSEIIVLIRDIAFLSVLALGAMLAFILVRWYRWGSNLLNSGKRIAKHAEDISSTLSTRFVEPASALGSALSVGKAGSLLLWPTRSWRRLGLTALAGVSALAWAKNRLGLRDRNSAGAPLPGKVKDSGRPMETIGGASHRCASTGHSPAIDRIFAGSQEKLAEEGREPNGP